MKTLTTLWTLYACNLFWLQMDDELKTRQVITTAVTCGNSIFIPHWVWAKASVWAQLYLLLCSYESERHLCIFFICSIESSSQKSNLEHLGCQFLLIIVDGKCYNFWVPVLTVLMSELSGCVFWSNSSQTEVTIGNALCFCCLSGARLFFFFFFKSSNQKWIDLVLFCSPDPGRGGTHLWAGP